ncbi:MAG: glycoside hydrolase family 43 protein [Adhaeribacter sp.]
MAASLCAATVSCKGPEAGPQARNGQLQDISLADPAMFFHKGTYYLYGTGGNKTTNQGFVVYTSRDMKSWEGPKGAKNGYALAMGDVFGERGFWAPQVFAHNNKFYMAYTANESIAFAESDSPLGPFTQKEKKALASSVRQIDPYFFIDDDGKKYLYHVRVADGGNRLFVAEIADDFSALKPETLRPCLEATEPWENTEKAKWSVTEGPTILKHKGLYYFIYSANDFRSPNYAVGYAVGKSAVGPFVKAAESPILHRRHVGFNGTGHGDLVTGKEKDLNYVFHTHQSETVVGPRKTAMVKFRFVKKPAGGHDLLKAEEKTFRFLQAGK